MDEYIEKMEFLKSFTWSRISGTGWAVIPTRRSGQTDIPTRAFISMMFIFTTTVTLGICFIPWRPIRNGTSGRTILNIISHMTLLWLKRWIFFLPPVRRHWARILCSGRAPLSPVRRLKSLREWILTRGTPPLWRAHSTIIAWRWTDFRCQNLRARWGIDMRRRMIQQSPTEYIKISKSDGIIITFVNPNTNINRQTFPQQIFCQPIKSLCITICNGWSNRADFGSKSLYRIVALLQDWKTIIFIQVIKFLKISSANNNASRKESFFSWTITVISFCKVSLITETSCFRMPLNSTFKSFLRPVFNWGTRLARARKVSQKRQHGLDNK